MLNILRFFVCYFPKKSVATTRNCRLSGPWAVRAVTRLRVDVFKPAFGATIGGHVGVWVRSSGGKWRSRGGNNCFKKICGGISSPACGQKGGSLKIPRVPWSLSPEQRARKETGNVCTLTKGWGRLATALELWLGQFGARKGASRGRLMTITPFHEKCGGYTPIDHFPKYIYITNVQPVGPFPQYLPRSVRAHKTLLSWTLN